MHGLNFTLPIQHLKFFLTENSQKNLCLRCEQTKPSSLWIGNLELGDGNENDVLDLY